MIDAKKRIFQESNIEFEFDSSYSLIKSDENPNISNAKKYLQGTKDIDFIGFYSDKQGVIFLEVKNFRGSASENIEELCNEVAQKLRDTVSIIAGASRNTTNDAVFWKSLHQFIGNEKKDILLIFWLEEDASPGDYRNQGRIKAINDKLKIKCKWLTSKVLVQNMEDHRILNDVKATFLPHSNSTR